MLNGFFFFRYFFTFTVHIFIMKKIPVGVALLLFTSLAIAQIKSPGQFLGYTLGSRYTPHYNVVNYCKYVAEAASNMVKLEQYGTTNEGRPLLLLYVTMPDNLSRLEAIRQNNLRLAGMTM